MPRHVRRPVRCGRCGRPFPSAEKRSKHERRVHGKQDDTSGVPEHVSPSAARFDSGRERRPARPR